MDNGTSSEIPEWLPALVLLEDYGGQWERYLEAVYNCFVNDFIWSKPYYRNKRCGYKRYPVSNGKEFTFWHLISEGKVEEERTPDIRRCERIKWPRPIIEKDDSEKILIWSERINKENRIHLALPDFSYVVVLADRRQYVLLWTAFFIERHHRREKMKKRYEKALKS